tara:strand:- start:189 stop:461 length:273 start_codon:yes stop_codon:yes gene_type:complete
MVRATRSAADATQIPHSRKSQPEPAGKQRSQSKPLSRAQTSPRTIESGGLKQKIANQSNTNLLVISSDDVQNFQASTDNNNGQKQSEINA